MAKRDIVVVGASLGGVEALRALVRGLPADFSAAVLVVLHRRPESRGLLVDILNAGNGTGLGARVAKDGATIQRGCVYVAPPDRHLLVDRGKMRVVVGPKENRHRPAIDPLFRSAAQSYGSRVIGVILTGGLDDGAAGLAEVKTHGGLAIVQDPHDAVNPSMPMKALELTRVDYCLPLAEIPAKLTELAGQNVKAPKAPSATKLVEKSEPAAMICPDCGGALRATRVGEVTQFSCHVGHRFDLTSLVAAQGDNLEGALWTAVRSLKERAALQRQLAREMKTSHFNEKAHQNERHAATIERVLATTIT